MMPSHDGSAADQSIATIRVAHELHARILRVARKWIGVWLACYALACSSSETINVPLWVVPDAPFLQIGAVEAAPEYEFTDVGGLVVLEDGQIAVADAGAAEVRLFDPSGRFLRRIGRKGTGPGEFRRLRTVYATGGDSLVAYDEAGYRLSEFTTDGTLIKTENLDSVAQDSVFRLDTWLRGRFWIVGARETERRRVFNAILDRFVLPDREFRFAVADRDEHVWVREPLDSARAPQRWTVLGPVTVPVAVVTVPSGLEVLQIYGDTVVGRWRDPGTDVNFVRFYRARATTDSAQAPLWTARVEMHPSADPADTAGLRGVIQLLVDAQERYYGANGTYAGAVGELEWDKPRDIGVRIVAARSIGWFGAFIPAHGNFVCGVGVGYVGPPGWPEGRLVCSPPPAAESKR